MVTVESAKQTGDVHLVAIPARLFEMSSQAFGDQVIVGMMGTYVARLQAAGLTPVVVPTSDGAAASRVLDSVDALLVPGGHGIDPGLYGGDRSNPHLATGDTSGDAGELEMIRYAASVRLPTLGVCRGLQAINVAFGGTLFEHLPTHQEDVAETARVGSHQVQVAEGSQLAAVLRQSMVLVNSLHHQGVACVATSMIPVAWSSDGVIEGLEPVDSAWPMLAVQWHPEFMVSPAVHARLFDWLAAAAVTFHNAKALRRSRV